MKGPPGARQEPRAQEEAERQDRHRNEDLGDACAKIEEELEALKARFEMYFLGIERREPARERQEMKRRVAHLKNQFTRNTGLRFRIQTLHARFLSYERMWLRSAREKEEGTYRRDILKARRHAQLEERKQAEKAQEAAAARGATTAPEAKPSPPPPSPMGGMSEAQLRSIYDAKSVEFKVVIKDGRAVLKAVPRV